MADALAKPHALQLTRNPAAQIEQPGEAGQTPIAAARRVLNRARALLRLGYE